MKQTKQKEAILNLVQNSRNHLSADEIYFVLKIDNSRLSLGTVYRNLNSFAEDRKIRKVTVPGHGDRYDWRLEPHEHLHCSRCGGVYDVDMSIDLTAMLPEGFGGIIDGYTLLLHGVCAECNAGIGDT